MYTYTSLSLSLIWSLPIPPSRRAMPRGLAKAHGSDDTSRALRGMPSARRSSRQPCDVSPALAQASMAAFRP